MNHVALQAVRQREKPRTSRYPLRLFAGLVAALLLFAACSSSDDVDDVSSGETPETTGPTPVETPDSTDETPETSDSDGSGETDTDTDDSAEEAAPTASTPALTDSFRGVTADAIKIGFIDVDFERLRTEYGVDVGSPDTGVIMEALVADLNEQGGINGRQVEVIVEKFLPANAAAMDEVCLKVIEDEEVFAVVGGFGGPGSAAGNICITGLGETILSGGQITDENLADAAAPWISPDMNNSRRGTAFVNALVESGELDSLGVLAVHAVLDDQDEAADVIEAALVDAGATVALRSTGQAGGDQIAAIEETSVMIERAGVDGVESFIVVGTSPTVTDTIFDAGDFTVVVPNTEEVANLEHATFGDGDRLLGAGSIAQLDDPELSACLAIATETIPADAIPADANDDDLSFWTSTLRACRNFALFVAVATEAGPDLTNDSFAAALATVELPPLPVYPFASLGPDKPDARDTLSLLEWNAETAGFTEFAGPFDVAG